MVDGAHSAGRARFVASLAAAALGAAMAAACGSYHSDVGDHAARRSASGEAAASAPSEHGASLALHSAERPGHFVGDRQAALTAGLEVLDRHQCARCHSIPDAKVPGRAFHCTECHQFLHGLAPGSAPYESIANKYGRSFIERYQRNIVHLIEVPSLAGLGRRVRIDWIRAFLREPYDVRPMLEESMIRHALSPTEIETVARYFAAEADVSAEAPPPADAIADRSPSRIAAGKALFRERGCTNCHTFGNVDFGQTKAGLAAFGKGAQLAPNLRFVRERTRRDVLVDWILEPSAIKPKTEMPPWSGPTQTATERAVARWEAESIAAFLLGADPALAAVDPPRLDDKGEVGDATLAAMAPKPLGRWVDYEEMKAKVLGKVCVHCHMNDHEKDNGPGNKGGLGFAGVGLRMRTYETLVSGTIGTDGKRYSVLEPEPGESLPPIVEVLLRRKIEGARDQVEPWRDHARLPYAVKWGRDMGMPLGLPAMSDEAVAVMVTWIAEGCPGPTTVTGQPGIGDGLLVPDGPIAKNHGCELRMPEEKRPSWSYEATRTAASASPSASGAPKTAAP